MHVMYFKRHTRDAPNIDADTEQGCVFSKHRHIFSPYGIETADNVN